MATTTQNGLAAGERMHQLMSSLFPICRSITGNGVRESLALLAEEIPLDITEVSSGTTVFDWTIPEEWNPANAWIKGPDGTKIVDFQDNNLHLVSYSVPIHERLSLAELRPHLHSLPEKPEAIPYRTSYYSKNWGFCLPHNTLQSLADGEYEVFIDTRLEKGSLTYGEYLHRGAVESEIVIYSHLCHPGLANDNLSGLVVNTFLAKWLSDLRTHFSYRFVFAPGTIGSITWLARNENTLERIRCVLVSVLLGGHTPFTYKKSRNGDQLIDDVVQYALAERNQDYDVVDFSPYGYDERQFGSPGIDIAAGRLTRAPNNEYAEYHTSADNLDYVDAASLEDSLDLLKRIVHLLDKNRRYVNQSPKCEPQLGKYGLYGETGGSHIRDYELALLWVLNQSTGKNSILDIARASGLPFDSLLLAAERLQEKGLLNS